ncbi:uncharacterized protein LOC108679000 isoform X2 [Hyalella azteca]|uniref:Uncharacterized protein LOC108679000 isoform X2 n=1 Tax=Hyalella azteca TaxID=294128 RepID=A0A8B7PA97_HYAAZ|nr:uncharacterized protein LOC108679000 isoform X2 [Hyalella azteca]
MWRCIVSDCCNASGARRDISMFYLPAEKHNAVLWLKRVGRMDLLARSGNPYKFIHRVCSRHFSQNQYNLRASFKTPRLLPNAVPDQELPSVPNASDECNQAAEKHSSKLKLELRVDTVNSIQELQLGTSCGDAGPTAKKIVRLQLPPGMTVQEFAASKAFKEITSKLPTLVNNNNNNKSVLLTVPRSAASTSTIAADEISENDKSNGSADRSSLSSEITAPSEKLSVNISGGSSATKIQLVRVKARDVLCNNSSSASNTSLAFPNLIPPGPLLHSNPTSSFSNLPFSASHSGPTSSSSNPPLSGSHSRSLYTSSQLSHNSFSTARQRRSIHTPRYEFNTDGADGDIDDEEDDACNEETDEEASDDKASVKRALRTHYGDSAPKKRKLEPESDVPNMDTSGDASGADKRAYYQFMHDLDVKRRMRNSLLEKIRHQKELLVKRSKELQRYRIQLQRIREKNSQRGEMSTAECLQVLNGNMREHALELLYTQLMAAQTAHQDGMESSANGDASSSRVSGSAHEERLQAESESQESNSAMRMPEEIVYTPKVLEAALLFSVAGKKAYKAMTQSLKLPSYSEIVKWKKIIRMNPPFYRKHFPHLKAKFFKKKRPEERGKRKDLEAEPFSHAEERPTECYGWQSEQGTSHKTINNSSKKSDSVTPEEADRMYKKLIETERKLRAILSGGDASSKSSRLDNDEELDDPMPDDDTIDYNLEASEFIKHLKAREKRLIYGDNWEHQIAELEERDDISDSEFIDSRSMSVSEQTTVELTSVNEAIDRVISNVVSKKGTSEDPLQCGTRTLSITATSDGSPHVQNDDQCLDSNVLMVDTQTLDVSLRLNPESHDHVYDDACVPISTGRGEGSAAISVGDQIIPYTETRLSLSKNSTVGTGDTGVLLSSLKPERNYKENNCPSFSASKKVTFFTSDANKATAFDKVPIIIEPASSVTVDNRILKGISFKILDSDSESYSNSAISSQPGTGISTSDDPCKSSEFI